MSPDRFDRRTKAQLLERLDELGQQLAELSAEKAQHQKANPAVHEADALRGCVRALDVLLPATNQYNAPTGTAAIGRLLRLLAAKYGVPLVEVQVRDCARKHVDELNGYALGQAVKSAAAMS